MASAFKTEQDRIDSLTMRIENPNIVGSGYIQFPPQKPFEKPLLFQPPTCSHMEFPEEYQGYAHQTVKPGASGNPSQQQYNSDSLRQGPQRHHNPYPGDVKHSSGKDIYQQQNGYHSPPAPQQPPAAPQPLSAAPQHHPAAPQHHYSAYRPTPAHGPSAVPPPPPNAHQPVAPRPQAPHYPGYGAPAARPAHGHPTHPAHVHPGHAHNPAQPGRSGAPGGYAGPPLRSGPPAGHAPPSVRPPAYHSHAAPVARPPGAVAAAPRPNYNPMMRPPQPGSAPSYGTGHPAAAQPNGRVGGVQAHPAGASSVQHAVNAATRPMSGAPQSRPAAYAPANVGKLTQELNAASLKSDEPDSEEGDDGKSGLTKAQKKRLRKKLRETKGV